MKRFIILCGGTGGHLAPGIAIGKSLISSGCKVSFVISKKQVDSKLMEKYPELKIIRSPGVGFSLNPIKTVRFFVELAKSFVFGMNTIKKGKFDAIISFGGFNSLGFSLAAIILKRPLILHEANRKAGKATRLLGWFARRIYVPFGVKISRRKSGLVKSAGYPVREEIKKLPEDESKMALGFEENAKLLLILGGSQGAAVLNGWIKNNFPKLAENNIDALCVCGPGKLKYENCELAGSDGKFHKLKFMEFCDDMALVMSAASLVIARAGAGSIAEFARCELPSILVPYPFSSDKHQLENANFFERQGCCAVVLQKDMDNLLEESLSLISNDDLRGKMKFNLRRADYQNDMSRIIKDLKKVAKEND